MQNLPPSFRFVDTHCHVDLFPNVKQIVDEVIEQEICTIAVTNAPFLFPNTRQLAENTPLLLPALGMHPELVKSHGKQIDQFLELLPSVRFIGEVGLDYVTNDENDRRQQRHIFESIVNACAESGDKVLTVHSRRSVGDVLAILEGQDPGTVIFHWYSGSLRDVRLALSAGYYFSVNLPMLRSERGRRIIQELPLDRILTETDGPFAKREGQSATPSGASLAVDGLAGIFDMSPEEIRLIINRNAEVALGT